MKNQVDYKYGKDLQFVHTEESFDEESRPLAKFICKWADNNRQFHRSAYYYGYYDGAMEKVSAAQGAVLVEKAGSTLYNEIVAELELLKRQEIPVLGGITVE